MKFIHEYLQDLIKKELKISTLITNVKLTYRDNSRLESTGLIGTGESLISLTGVNTAYISFSSTRFLPATRFGSILIANHESLDNIQAVLLYGKETEKFFKVLLGIFQYKKDPND